MSASYARPSIAAHQTLLSRNRAPLLFAYVAALVCLAVTLTPSSDAVGSTLAAAIPLHPYAYASVNSTAGYDVMVADGVNKDSRAARIKVDSVFFTDVDARLSTDGSNVAFRVTGDHLGGSSLYAVNTWTGKYVLIASSRTAVEGIGSYAWSPAGNTLAFVRAAPALDPALMDGAYGTVYLFSAGFQAVKLQNSNGNDRVLGFSSDGLGIYVDRRETTGSDTLNHLLYLPITGGPATLLLHSQQGLRYTGYDIWAQQSGYPRVAYLAEGDFSLALANTNVRALLPGMTPSVQAASGAGPGGKLSRPSGLGLMVSDVLGINQTLLRRDAEDYGTISWSLDGSALLTGGARSGGSWRVGMDGSRVALGVSLLGLDARSYSQDGTKVVLSDDPTTRMVTVDSNTGKVAATKYVGASVKPYAAQVRLNVPYIQQVNDAPDNVDGDWACGPTSVAMSLAYYGKLEPWSRAQARNENIVAMGLAATPAGTPTATPIPAGTDFAPYVTSAYAFNGHTYNALAADPRGTLVAGLYGTICPTGLASWPMMVSVLEWHGLDSQYVPATWDGVVAALRRGHPVLLGNMLTSAGHIILVTGYTADGNLVANDPYGDKFSPGYGSNNGHGVLYPWKRVTARRALEIIGTYPPPTSTPTLIPTSTRTATAVATVTSTSTAAAPTTPPPPPAP